MKRKLHNTYTLTVSRDHYFKGGAKWSNHREHLMTTQDLSAIFKCIRANVYQPGRAYEFVSTRKDLGRNWGDYTYHHTRAIHFIENDTINGTRSCLFFTITAQKF